MNNSIHSEEEFHDQWAKNANLNEIDLIKINEALTSPELRYINKRMGSLQGVKLLDLGSGLGEAGVYFALRGADVTLSDLSGEMLYFSNELAKKHNVIVKTLKGSAESIVSTNLFDIVYAGNLLHHVDIEKTLLNISSLINKDGTFYSWDPLAYNPIINVYRRIATQVRTADEHPLTIKDLRLFKKYFSKVEYKYFWFSTLFIFILMFAVQFRNPNKERFWKKVVDEENKWKYLYIPLKKLDDLILFIFPFLRILCWNVVVIARK